MTRSVTTMIEQEQDRGGGLLQPDPVLPLQLLTARRGETAQGERRLLLAILEDAILCYRKHLFARDNRGRRLFREAEQWMRSDNRQLLFSFENVCDILGINPDYVRAELHRWRCRQLTGLEDLVCADPQSAALKTVSEAGRRPCRSVAHQPGSHGSARP